MRAMHSPDRAQPDEPEPRILSFAAHAADTHYWTKKTIVPTTIPIVRITPDTVSHVTVEAEYRGNFRMDKDPFAYVLASLGLD